MDCYGAATSQTLTCWLFSGGDEEDRTPDLRIANAALSQLSYVPINRELYHRIPVAKLGTAARAQRSLGVFRFSGRRGWPDDLRLAAHAAVTQNRAHSGLERH